MATVRRRIDGQKRNEVVLHAITELGGKATAPEIALHLRMPSTNVYTALERMETVGIVTVVAMRPTFKRRGWREGDNPLNPDKPWDRLVMGKPVRVWALKTD